MSKDQNIDVFIINENKSAINYTKKNFIIKNHIVNKKLIEKFFGKKLGKKTKKILIVLAAIFSILFIILFLLFALIPCSLTICHEKTSNCVNRLFYADCVCRYGFAGDGKKFCDECGLYRKQPNARIVGGIEALPDSWPSAALIITNYKADIPFKRKMITVEASFLCGGTLINRKTVLTAAHCLLRQFDYEYKGSLLSINVVPNRYFPTFESMYRVHLGVHDRTKLLSKEETVDSISVEKIIMHQNFNEEKGLNDLTILKLSKVVNLDEDTQIACLPDPKWSRDFPVPGTPAWILGWGRTSENGYSPSSLQNSKIKIYHSSTCNKVSYHDRDTFKSLICAGDLSGLKDTCQGDSGGSIFVRDKINNKTKFISAGIVSYGEGCGRKFKPGLYTRNIYYLDWIYKHSRF